MLCTRPSQKTLPLPLILTFDVQEVIRAGRFLAAQIIPECTDIPEDGISIKGIYGDEDRRKAGA